MKIGLSLLLLCVVVTWEKEVEVVFSDNNTCYAFGQARACKPPYGTLSEGLPVETSSECGRKGPSEDVCRKWVDSNGKTKSFCQECNANYPKHKLGGEILTDPEKSNDGTCWASDLVPREVGQNVVNVTISFGKSFEVTLVSIKPCGQLPDGMVIYKSLDNGKSWTPWQYYSNDCYRAFKLPTSYENAPQLNSINIKEAQCSLFPDYKANTYNKFGQWKNSLAFNTQAGRSGSNDSNAILDEFITATDVRISMIRIPSGSGFAKSTTPTPSAQEGSVFSFSDLNSGGFSAGLGEVETYRYRKQAVASTPPQTEQDSHRFFLASINIVGRCKCNGHSNRCVRDIIKEKDIYGKETVKKGPLRCDCQHNTKGDDCDACSEGFQDQPWGPGTESKASECKACQCNNHGAACSFSSLVYLAKANISGSVCNRCKTGYVGDNCERCSVGYGRNLSVGLTDSNACIACDCNLHSSNCEFSQEVWEGSRHKTGGVCNNCSHNTTGRKCQQCEIGYYRDWDKPMSHEVACVPCNCNKLGSLFPDECDRRSGQCKCKEGVTGKNCAQCAKGYMQTNDETRPCVKG
ncbi:Netrin-1, partial [Cichlidogyrus casuarinus]